MTEVFREGNVENAVGVLRQTKRGCPTISAVLRLNSNFPEADFWDSDERFDADRATTQPPIEPERPICFPSNWWQRIQERSASDYRRYTPPTPQTRTLPGRANL